MLDFSPPILRHFRQRIRELARGDFFFDGKRPAVELQSDQPALFDEGEQKRRPRPDHPGVLGSWAVIGDEEFGGFCFQASVSFFVYFPVVVHRQTQPV